MSTNLPHVETRTSAGRRPVWLPPLASVATLFVLFLAAMAVRRSSYADSGRPLMIVLSTLAAVAIALYGVKMLAASRGRGIAGALAGALMVVLGASTLVHVLK